MQTYIHTYNSGLIDIIMRISAVFRLLCFRILVVHLNTIPNKYAYSTYALVDNGHAGYQVVWLFIRAIRLSGLGLRSLLGGKLGSRSGIRWLCACMNVCIYMLALMPRMVSALSCQTMPRLNLKALS